MLSAPFQLFIVIQETVPDSPTWQGGGTVAVGIVCATSCMHHYPQHGVEDGIYWTLWYIYGMFGYKSPGTGLQVHVWVQVYSMQGAGKTDISHQYYGWIDNR